MGIPIYIHLYDPFLRSRLCAACLSFCHTL
jgi:hypothetical protein